MVAVGLFFFLMPENLAVGGANGLAIVLNYFFPQLSVGILMIIINILLFIIGFVFIGTNFGFRTIYASLGVSGIVVLFERLLPMHGPLVEDILLQLIFGIFISAIGMGIVFNQNASTGGTDVIAKILNSFLGIDLGKGVLLADFFITLMAGFIYGAELGMYSLLGVIVNGFVVDETIEGMNISKQVSIVSQHNEHINDYIIESLGKGVTLYSAKGGFSGEEKEVLVTVLNRKEFIELKRYIYSVDQEAFVTVSDVYDIKH